jgi:hypothetical protein
MSSTRFLPYPPERNKATAENIAAANARVRQAAAKPLPANVNLNGNAARKNAIKKLSPNGDEGINDELSSLEANSPVSYKRLGSNNGEQITLVSAKEEPVKPTPSPFHSLAERIASPFRSRAQSEASEPGVPVITPPKRPVMTPSMFNKFRNSLKAPSKRTPFTEMEKHTRTHFLASTLAKAYAPKREDIKEDMWYSRAIDTPNTFADMLIKSSNIAHFKVDGKLLFDEEDITKIRSYLTPEVIKAAVNSRKASYLLEIARSPCFEEVVIKDSAKFLRFKSGSMNESFNEAERKGFADGLPAFYANTALLLLDGADIGNFDNLEWDVPSHISESDKLKYIFDNHLIPTGVKPNETAQKRFPRCAPYLRRRSAAELSSLANDPVSEGGKRKTRRNKRKGLRKSMRRR